MKPAFRARSAPKAFLGAAVALGVLCAWLMVILATRTPSLGLKLRPAEQGTGAIVSAVYEDGPAAGVIVPGERIVGIASPTGETLPIDAETLIEEPDFLPSYERLAAFFENQDRIRRALDSPQVRLVLADGEQRVVRPGARSEAWLPAVFWFQLACGFIALVTGAAVYALRRDQVAPRLYVLTGLAFAIITFPAAVYSGRELALDGTTFRYLAAADHFGSMFFIATFIALLWNYPRALGKLPVFPLLSLVCAAIWIFDTLWLLPSPDWGIRVPYVIVMLSSVTLGIVQWRRAARDPIGRAGLRWFLFSVLIGGSCFVVAIFFTVWIGRQPMLPQGYAFGLVLSTYIGIALGVTRHRLFELERWWVSVWLWAVAGACVVIIDLLLAHALRLNQTSAVGLSILLMGWVYFPARQWLLGRLARRQEADLRWLLPKTVKLVLGASSPENLSRDWRRMLERLFDPLEVSDSTLPEQKVSIAEEGLALHVPGVAGQRPTLLRLAQRGLRLFKKQDPEIVQALHELVQYALVQRDAYERGVHSERERLARDLHDDIGSRLLTLVHRSDPGSRIAELARETLRELRTVVSTLGAGSVPLGEAMADWRSEAAERCDAAKVELHFHHTDDSGDYWLDSATRTNVLRVLREALSNALHHARPERIEITAGAASGVLSFSVIDDGQSPAPESWQKGRGLSNIDRRITELGGEHELRREAPWGTRLAFRVPLPSRGDP